MGARCRWAGRRRCSRWAAWAWAPCPARRLFRLLAGVAFGDARPAGAPVRPPVVVDRCAPGQTHEPKDCPNLDDDDDGVKNGADKCPTEAGPALRQGCPVKGLPPAPLDTDKDGVEDAADKCPTEPGLAAAPGLPVRHGQGRHRGRAGQVPEGGRPPGAMGCPAGGHGQGRHPGRSGRLPQRGRHRRAEGLPGQGRGQRRRARPPGQLPDRGRPGGQPGLPGKAEATGDAQPARSWRSRTRSSSTRTRPSSRSAASSCWIRWPRCSRSTRSWTSRPDRGPHGRRAATPNANSELSQRAPSRCAATS